MEETLAAIVAQNRDLAAQNKEILSTLGNVLPRIQNLESKIMRGEPPTSFKQSPSSASADTHIMIEDDESSQDHAPRPLISARENVGGFAQDHVPRPPVSARENFGEFVSPLIARSVHQSSDHSFGILKDPNIKMVRC